MCYYNPLHRSRRFINQYFRFNWAEIASHSTKQQHKPKLFTRSIVMCFAEKSSQMRLGCSQWSLVSAWSKHWRQCARAFDRQVVRLRLASRWRLAVAKGLRENCRDVGWAPREKYKLWFVIVRASTIWNLVVRHIFHWPVRASER